MEFTLKDNKIYFIRGGERGVISACAEGCIRFKATASPTIEAKDWTLMPKETEAKVWMEGETACLKTGELTVRVGSNARCEYFIGEKSILKEQPEQTFFMHYRNYRSVGSGLWSMRVSFEPNEDEEFYGLGHERMNVFSKKGCTVDLRHLNTKSSVPYVYSSLGYGFLWNMPSTGLVELGKNRTRWYSDCAKVMDYVVISGNPKEACSKLADLTGHAPKIPEWALGFWQSKLRYETQEDVLRVARKYKELGVPLSVIVIDYFHWTEQGDYKFDPVYWPDPKKMADELHEMGIKLMVSMWPTINEKSENYDYMVDHNMLLRTASGSNRVFDFYGPQAEIDATNPDTRKYVWSRIKKNYIDNGVDLMWFDEAEPEVHPEHFDNLIMHAGRGDEVALIYPYYYAKLVYDGMKEIGRDDIITLSRAAYTGVQRYGALVWSGDIHSSFESLTEQVKSGLNMAMCGIPWWNTDIGGFFGGDIKSDEFRELIVRWFQYGVFSPVMRLHGSRDGSDRTRDIKEPTGGDNEIWSFGDENLPVLSELIKLRYRLIPYISRMMDIASKEGIPVMRPMFLEYPDDKVCYEIGDQYMFGDDILFAPITSRGQVSRKIYLPEGNWVLVGTENCAGDSGASGIGAGASGRTGIGASGIGIMDGASGTPGIGIMDGASGTSGIGAGASGRKCYEGKQWVEVTARVDEFIAFIKEGAEVETAFLS